MLMGLFLEMYRQNRTDILPPLILKACVTDSHISMGTVLPTALARKQAMFAVEEIVQCRRSLWREDSPPLSSQSTHHSTHPVVFCCFRNREVPIVQLT